MKPAAERRANRERFEVVFRQGRPRPAMFRCARGHDVTEAVFALPGPVDAAGCRSVCHPSALDLLPDGPPVGKACQEAPSLDEGLVGMKLC
jgi:hypothetical protein